MALAIGSEASLRHLQRNSGLLVYPVSGGPENHSLCVNSAHRLSSLSLFWMVNSACLPSASGLTRPISTRERGLTLWKQKAIHQYARHDKHLQSITQSTDNATHGPSPFYTISSLLNGREISWVLLSLQLLGMLAWGSMGFRIGHSEAPRRHPPLDPHWSHRIAIHA